RSHVAGIRRARAKGLRLYLSSRGAAGVAAGPIAARRESAAAPKSRRRGVLRGRLYRWRALVGGGPKRHPRRKTDRSRGDQVMAASKMARPSSSASSEIESGARNRMTLL